MSISAASSSYVQYTPQVMAAQETATRQAIDIAVINKSRAASDAQAVAVLNMLQQVASGIDGVGENVNVRV